MRAQKCATTRRPTAAPAPRLSADEQRSPASTSPRRQPHAKSARNLSASPAPPSWRMPACACRQWACSPLEKVGHNTSRQRTVRPAPPAALAPVMRASRSASRRPCRLRAEPARAGARRERRSPEAALRRPRLSPRACSARTARDAPAGRGRTAAPCPAGMYLVPSIKARAWRRDLRSATRSTTAAALPASESVSARAALKRVPWEAHRALPLQR